MRRAAPTTVQDETDATTRRRPGDAVRIVIAAILLVPLSFHADSPTHTERAIVEFFDSLPNGAETLFRIVYDAASLWALGLLAATLLVTRRWRLVRDLVTAGLAAWVLGRLLAVFVPTTDLVKAFEITFDLTDTPRYPLVRLAVTVAMVIVASPHLTRPTRRVGQGLVAVLALVAMYLGRAYPTDLLGAVVVGWGVAAGVHYVFGTPAGRPSTSQVHEALTGLGVAATRLHLAPEQSVGRAVFLADGAEGPLRIVALGRDEADAQWLARAWRFVRYRNAPPTLLPTRRQQVEYEAYVALLARVGGVRVPRVVIAGVAGPNALLVEQFAIGARLNELDVDALTDDVLNRIWNEVQRLHEMRVSHGKLDGRHVLITDGTPTIVGFAWGSTITRWDQALGDIAQLLAATAGRVGSERAIAAAIRGVGPEAVGGALPLLQPAALSGWTHDSLGGRRALDGALEELRNSGAAALGIEAPELRALYRVHPRMILMAVGALVAVGVLLSRVGDPAEFWDTLRDANWLFVALAFALGLLTDATYGVTFLGTVPVRIPVWPSIELQSALSFSNLAIPVAADSAMQVRFLQKNGLDLASAVASGGLLSTISELLVQIGVFFVALWLAPDSIDLGRIDTQKVIVVVLIAVFVLGVVGAILFGVRRLRRAVLPPIMQAGRTMWSAVKTPGRLALLIVGNVVAQCLSAGALLACLHAFGASVNFWTLLALTIGIGTIASLVPIPGGGTAVSAIGLAGALTALGVPEPSAAAAVLAQQLTVSYLPAIPGWFLTNDLIRKGYL